MALTFRRWCVALLVGTLLLGVAYLPPKSIDEGSRWLRWAFFGGVRAPRSRLAVAAEQWARLAELEALRRAPPAGSAPQVILRNAAPPVVGRLADSLVTRFWNRAPRTDSTIRLRVVMWYRNDRMDVGTAQEQPQVLLPEATDGRTCLVLLPELFRTSSEVNPSSQWRSLLRRAVAPALAPCVLRAAFGRPGPAVDRWLRGRGYDLALSLDWAVGGNLLEDYWWYEAFEGRSPELLSFVSRIIGELPRAYGSSPDGLACLGGNLARCTAAVTATRQGDSAAVQVTLPGMFRSRTSDLGINEHRFVSDLIRERGLESFQRFWVSPQPVAAAFAEAYGEPLSDWTRRWMVRNSGEVDLGAGLHLVGTLGGLLLALVLVGLAAWGALTREIG